MKIKEKISRINLPAKASMAYLGVSFVGKIIGIVATPFFTRLISGEEYGRLILYMTILGGASIICSAISSGSAIYRCYKIFGDKNGDFIKTSLLVSVTFSLLICILLFAFLPFFELDRTLYLPLTLQILCDTVIATSLARARYQYRYQEVMWITLIGSALPVIFSLTVIKRYGSSYGVRVYSMLFISVVIAIAELIRMLRLPGKPKFKMATHLLKSAMPTLPHSLSGAFSGQADKLFITTLMGAGALAKYSVAHSLGIALQFAITALGSALGPWMIRKLDSLEVKKTSRVISATFSLFCATSLGLCALAPEAFKILAPEEYFIALPAVLPIALSTPLAFISYTVTVGLVHSDKGRYNATISIIGTMVCLALNFLLIPSLGYFGAGIALLLSQLAQTWLGIYYTRRSGLAIMFDTKLISRGFILTAAGSLLIFAIYGHLSLRVLFLIIPATVFIGALVRSKQLITE